MCCCHPSHFSLVPACLSLVNGERRPPRLTCLPRVCALALAPSIVRPRPSRARGSRPLGRPSTRNDTVLCHVIAPNTPPLVPHRHSAARSGYTTCSFVLHSRDALSSSRRRCASRASPSRVRTVYGRPTSCIPFFFLFPIDLSHHRVACTLQRFGEHDVARRLPLETTPRGRFWETVDELAGRLDYLPPIRTTLRRWKNIHIDLTNALHKFIARLIDVKRHFSGDGSRA